MDAAALRLSDVRVGDTVTVLRVGNDRPIAIRLLELGLLPGTKVRVVRRAPMGDPIELHLRDYALSIRGEEARRIEVAHVTDGPT